MLAGADIKYSSASRFTDYHTIEDIDKEQRLMGGSTPMRVISMRSP